MYIYKHRELLVLNML